MMCMYVTMYLYYSQDQFIMDVVDSFVTTVLGVSRTRVFVVGIHHVVMDLMKQTAVRFDEISYACGSLCKLKVSCLPQIVNGY